MSKQEIAHTLTRFILEVRKNDGSVYPANSLHHIIVGLQRHIRACGCQVDLFKEEVFGDFRSSLDAEMKRIQGLGVGTRVRRAEIITVDEEETCGRKVFWATKCHNPYLTPSSFFVVFFCTPQRQGASPTETRTLPDSAGGNRWGPALSGIH